MPDVLTKKDLDTLETLLTYDSSSSMYAMLQSKGYKYAVLADGVVRENSLSGPPPIISCALLHEERE